MASNDSYKYSLEMLHHFTHGLGGKGFCSNQLIDRSVYLAVRRFRHYMWNGDDLEYFHHHHAQPHTVLVGAVQ